MMEVSPVTARRRCSSSARKVAVVELERKICFPRTSVAVVYGPYINLGNMCSCNWLVSRALTGHTYEYLNTDAHKWDVQ